MLSWAINEPSGIEHQIVRAICNDIARGVLLCNEAMPSPQVLSENKVLNPHVAQSAYAKLVEIGLLHIQPDGGHQIAPDAPQRARQCLLQWAKEDVKDLMEMLQRAGLSAEEVQSAFRETGDA